MASEWEESTLGNFAPFTYGKSLPARKRNENGIYKVYGSGGISGKHDEPLVNEPGIIIGRKGTVGSIQFSDKPFWPIDTVFYVIDAPERDLHFTYYLLQTLNLDQMNSDSAVPGLNRDTAHSVKIRIPSKKQQIKIASILKAFDDKIELNKKINQTLEQMAQAMFKSWFVDFDPVFDNLLEKHNNNFEKASAYLTNKGAKDLIPKLQQRHQVQQTSDYKPLPDHIKKEFPNDFQHHEDMGWIPEGWEVVAVKNICLKIQNGGTPKRDIESYWKDGGIPWLTSGEVRNNWIVCTNQYITEEGLSNSSAKLLTSGVTVVAMYGATAGEVGYSFIPITTNQAICSLTSLRHYQHYIYLDLKRKVSDLSSQARGSAQQNISKGIIENTLTVKVDEHLLIHFNKTIGVLFHRISHCLEEIDGLEALKDLLLPKLISGKLTVREG